MASFDNNLKMGHLLSALHGDAERSRQSIGSSGIFYATALKALKHDYGDPIIASHRRLKLFFLIPTDKKQLQNSFTELSPITITR